MVMIGRGDEYRVNLLMHDVEHSPVIRERLRLGTPRGGLLRGGGEAPVLHINDRDQVLPQRTLKAYLASPATADDGSTKFSLGRNVGKEKGSLQRLRGSHREGGAL